MVKKIFTVFSLSIFLLAFFVVGCTPSEQNGNNEDNNDHKNKHISLISPAKESNYYPSEVFLRWEKPEDSEISSYKVFLSKREEDVDKESVEAFTSDSNSIKISSLDYGKKYYWKVVGEASDSVYKSDIWSFSTKESSNEKYLIGIRRNGAYVFNVESPVGMVENAELSIPSSLSSMKVSEISGKLYAFVIENNKSFSIYEITNFNSTTTKINLPGNNEDLFDLVVIDNYVFIAAGKDGVEVYDVEDPENPEYIKEFPADEDGDYYTKVKEFHVTEDKKYVMAISDNAKAKVMVLDVDSLTIATTLEFDEDMKINSVFYDGEYLYTVSREEGFSIYKLEDFRTIEKISSINVGEDFLSEEYDVFIDGNYAYIAADSLFAVVNISYKENPNVESKVKVIGARKIIYDNDNEKVYLVGDSLGSFSYWLCVVDVSNQISPALLGTYRTLNGRAVDGAIVGNYFYLADENGKILKIDVSSPSGVKLENSLYKLDKNIGYKMQIEGNRIFAAKTDGYDVFDIDNGKELKEVYDSGFIGDGVGVSSISLDDEKIYLGFADGRINIYSQEDPQSVSGTPIDLRDYNASVGGIYVWKDHAYIASNGISKGLYVVNLNETPTGSYENFIPFDDVVSMTGKNDKIYLLTSNNVLIIDLTHRSSPDVLKTIDIENGVSIYVDKNDTIYVGTHDTMNDISKLVIIEGDFKQELSLPSYVQTMERIGSYLYLGLFSDGIAVVDVSNIINPRIVGWYGTAEVSDIKAY